MYRKSKFLVSITVLSILLILSVPIASAGPPDKMDVCHLDKDSGEFIKINISENAFPAHLDHGDGGPGDVVPGDSGKRFADDCTLNANLVGTWNGQSGLTGTMGYRFAMTLNQDAFGSVWGTVVYQIGITRVVDGTIAGNEFTFKTSDASYWADCNPCTVTVAGTHFHGYGTSSSNQNIEWDATKQ